MGSPRVEYIQYMLNSISVEVKMHGTEKSKQWFQIFKDKRQPATLAQQNCT